MLHSLASRHSTGGITRGLMGEGRSGMMPSGSQAHSFPGFCFSGDLFTVAVAPTTCSLTTCSLTTCIVCRFYAESLGRSVQVLCGESGISCVGFMRGKLPRITGSCG